METKIVGPRLARCRAPPPPGMTTWLLPTTGNNELRAINSGSSPKMTMSTDFF